MKVVLFGATGMVGQGVLRECLIASDVTEVLAVTRSSIAISSPKMRELIRSDFFDFSDAETELTGFDACFFCLGVTSVGKSEAEYTRLTFDLTLAAAQALAKWNPQMTFVYVSGVGTDSTESGSLMWARIKGRTENAILHLPFKAAYMFRPGAIQPVHGERPKAAGRLGAAYTVLGPVLTLMRRVFPNQVLSTEQIGQAMLQAVRRGAGQRVLAPKDIRALSSG